jgi:hypothetical protein
METKTSKDKEIRIPGPDHPITISPTQGRVRVTVAGRIVAESTRGSNICSDPAGKPLRGRFFSGVKRRWDAVNVRSILNSN